ncbi:MarR family winged helix-turn-helix transcriptional regulator [Actinoplanes derwentensis]|uniref:DNA-binding transcriptional regulator, MarR family n=1 Tax=Actinoplanes derwentensis TaxID=113562 RepID=A0A1H1Y220_9ACTN|nr:MarR family transcriptional regulator [Actinoplanes derwentensis]GID86752.1 hypothetical protein Ade03nite_56760 [Actinoplanes derwentensis]SDT15487.1 DNA-binding transcriptional regulator, MarR family [Actinoplanes derwentensis]
MPPPPVQIGLALRIVLQRYLAETQELLGPIPGGVHGYEILRAMAGEDHRTLTDLARRINVQPAVLTHRIDALEESGLLRREARPGDRRARRPVLTARGRTVVAGLDRDLRLAEDTVLQPLDPAGRAEFVAALWELAATPH